MLPATQQQVQVIMVVMMQTAARRRPATCPTHPYVCILQDQISHNRGFPRKSPTNCRRIAYDARLRFLVVDGVLCGEVIHTICALNYLRTRQKL